MESKLNPSELKKVSSYLKNRTALIASTTQNARVVIRKLLTDYGVLNENISMANNYAEAVEMLQSTRADIFFSEKNIHGKNITDPELLKKDGFDLIELHSKVSPNKLTSINCLIYEEESTELLSKCFESDIDLKIQKPISYQIIESDFVPLVMSKTKTNLESKLVEKLREAVIKKDDKIVLQLIEKLVASGTKSLDAAYLMGKYYYEKGENDLAEEALLQIDVKGQKHYKYTCLLNEVLFQVGNFEEAFEAVVTLTESFPLSIQRIPLMLKTTIASRNFSYIREISEAFRRSGIECSDSNKQIAAGLIVSSKSLIEERRQRDALSNLKEAIELSKYDGLITKKAIENMLSIDALNDVKDIIDKVEYDNDGDLDKDYQLLRLKLYMKEENFSLALTTGQSLIDNGIKEKEFFYICLESSVQMGRKKTLVEDIVHKAIQVFPESKNDFEKYLSKL